MELYEVASIDGRRVCPESGEMQYRVTWAGYDAAHSSWEPRHALTAYCSDWLAEVDQREVARVDDALRVWSCRKRLRLGDSPAPPGGTDLCGGADTQEPQHHRPKLEPLAGVAEVAAPSDSARRTDAQPLLISVLAPAATSSSPSSPRALRGSLPMPPWNEEGRHLYTETLLPLGESVAVGNMAESLLHSAKKRRAATAAAKGDTAGSLSEGLVAIERQWREKHAQGFMHACASSTRAVPATVFLVADGDRGCHERCDSERVAACPEGDASASEARLVAQYNVAIHSIAPAWAVEGGRFAFPTSCAPLLGDDLLDMIRTRCAATSTGAECNVRLGNQSERFVVRYYTDEEDAEDLHRPSDTACRRLVSAPLSVFRFMFPQLLIDYLLRHSMVLL